ncbi:helix-turn-helix domain-containing protein [Paenibacillus sp. NFR01]|uniref:helix-turn-helix domain-containing protein n=1 Tax=Paenibacillus sp. NFR01 TaxID=1566279 RepID=UPI0008C1891A|nr:helix-turn-helix domain-containing protein [Paenibacillus sp. NFR01]SET68304.1 AraC-type DNA-binding protein [Paenibacillus sp. NFR01]
MLKYSNVFRRFLISYVIILIIPSIGGYMSYRTSITVTQSLSIENSVTQLQKSQDILERRMAEVEGFTRQLAINKQLSVLMNERDNNTNVYGIWNTMQNVLTSGQTNDFLQDYYIYLANYNLILTSGSTYRPEHFYEVFHYNDLSLAQWRKEFLEKTHRSEIRPLSPFVERNIQTSVITYMQSLPLDSFEDSSPAVVIVNIDEKVIASMLTGLTERYGGWVHISDENGNTIVQQGEDAPYIGKLATDPAFDENKVSQFYKDDLVITTRSTKNGWVYQAGIPRSVLLENANRIKFKSWAITGGTLLLGLLVGLVLAYRNSAPINRLVGVMREQFGKEETPERDSFDFLSGNIANMITKNKQLESELDRQLPLIRDAFLKRLIAGEFESRDEILYAAEQADIQLGPGTGYTGVIQISGYAGMDSVEILNELNASRLLLKQALAERGEAILTTDIGSDKVVALFLADAAEGPVEEQRVEEAMERLTAYLFEEYKMTIQAGFGDPFTTVTEVSRSFEQAKQALEYAVYVNQKGMMWNREAQIENTTYYYPLDTEQRLISTVRAGELEEAMRIVDVIIAQNLGQRELSVEMKHQLVGEMKGTFLKLLDQKTFLESPLFENTKRKIIEIDFSDPLESIQEELHAIMEEMCGFVVSKKKDAHIQIIKQMYQYTAEMYADAELTLYRVAEHVERPEKYISQLFKEVTGVNYSDHLVKVRMDQAALLLKESNYTVDEIAARVGYNSSHSFRRAFKRLTGISPSTYRQSHVE